MHAYCLFCETQRCDTIAELIRIRYGYTSFSPKILQRKWVKGVPTEEWHRWLPGYLFFYTDELIYPHLGFQGIIRCLGKGELTGRDLAFAEMIYHKQGIMGTVPLIQEGDRCSIKDPAWAEMQGKVIKMDRGRKRCCIEFEFDGLTRTIWVGYEIMETERNSSLRAK